MGLDRAWSGKERGFTVKTYYLNNGSIIATQKQFKAHFGVETKGNVPSPMTIKEWVNRFEDSGTTFRDKNKGGAKSVRTPANIDLVQRTLDRFPELTVNELSEKLNISKTSLIRILKDDLQILGDDL